MLSSKARAFGHAIHPMMVLFPIGVLALVVVFDVVHFAGGDPWWERAAFWCNVIGGGWAILSAIPGLMDFLSVPEATRARRVGVTHGLVQGVAVLCFAISFVIRLAEGIDVFVISAFILAVAGLLALVVGSWFGNELVQRLGIGVYADANADAPSSYDVSAVHPSPRRYREPGYPGQPTPTEPTPA